MKFRFQTALTAAVYLLTAALISGQVRSEQGHKIDKHHRYVMVDLGTFGGPNSFVNGPTVKNLSDSGVYAGVAETAIPDPKAPNCQNGDCLIMHEQRWKDGIVTDLGSLPGLNNSGAGWPNDQGTIAGFSQNGVIDPLLGIPEIRAVAWAKTGEITDLGTLPGGTESFATSINNRGDIIGWSTNSVPDPVSMQGLNYQSRAVLWRNGKMRDLGTLGGPDSFPEIINDRGQIAGNSFLNDTPNPTTRQPTQHPFLWDDGVMIDLGSLGGSLGNANFLNNRGQVVGASNLAGDVISHPYLWERGVMRDLGSFGGTNAGALWINDAGEVVGIADLPGDVVHHGFLFKDGVTTDLGTMGTDPCSNAYAINSRGQIIGNSTNCHGVVLHVVLWEDGEIMDVNKLLIGGADIGLTNVWDINDRGEISGLHVLPDGNVHAAILLPCDDNHAHITACKDADSAPMNEGPPPFILRTMSEFESPLLPGIRTTRDSGRPRAIRERIRAQRANE